MPNRPALPCIDPRCANRQPCPKHPTAFATAKRAGEGLYTSRWVRESAAFVAGKVCVVCGGPATQTDHEPPHRGDPARFWDRTTWQPICARCHNSKTVREVNERRRVEVRYRATYEVTL